MIFASAEIAFRLRKGTPNLVKIPRVLLIVFAFLCGQVRGDDRCLTVNISSHPNYPPFHWKEGDTLIGASIDISRKIFDGLGVQVSVKYKGPWKRVLKSAQQGKIDFIPALKKNRERQEYLTFTTIDFESNPVAVFVRKGEMKNINGLNDLREKFGSINAGDRHGKDIDSFIAGQSTMQVVHGISQNFQMLERTRTDYFITGFFVGTDYLAANNLDNIFDVALKIEGPRVHNAFSHDFAMRCRHIVEGFEKALSELKHQGQVVKALSDYNDLWLSKTI